MVHSLVSGLYQPPTVGAAPLGLIPYYSSPCRSFYTSWHLFILTFLIIPVFAVIFLSPAPLPGIPPRPLSRSGTRTHWATCPRGAGRGQWCPCGFCVHFCMILYNCLLPENMAFGDLAKAIKAGGTRLINATSGRSCLKLRKELTKQFRRLKWGHIGEGWGCGIKTFTSYSIRIWFPAGILYDHYFILILSMKHLWHINYFITS